MATNRCNGDRLNQIEDQAVPEITKRQTKWSIAIFRGKRTKQRCRRTVFKLVQAVNSDHILNDLETVQFVLSLLKGE